MIYIFETCSPKRYLLNIKVIKQEVEVTLSKKKIDSDCLIEALESQLKISLPEGHIHELRVIDNIRVLIWDFKEFTRCSDASESNFGFVEEDDRLFDFTYAKLTPGVGLDFFTLGHNKSEVFEDENLQIVKRGYLFPDASEEQRLDAFRAALHEAKFYVNSVKATKSTQHFCEFSGGGDICVTAVKETSVPMVVIASHDPPPQTNEPTTSTQTNDPTTSKDLSPTKSPSHTSANSERSPLVTKNLAMVIEEFDKTKHKSQLWANMIVVVVRRFISAVQSFDKTKLLNLKELTGYGMACAGDGTVGVYKLEIDLTESSLTDPIKFITKLEIGRHQLLRAAELMDYSVHYYKKIITE